MYQGARANITGRPTLQKETLAREENIVAQCSQGRRIPRCGQARALRNGSGYGFGCADVDVRTTAGLETGATPGRRRSRRLERPKAERAIEHRLQCLIVRMHINRVPYLFANRLGDLRRLLHLTAFGLCDVDTVVCKRQARLLVEVDMRLRVVAHGGNQS